MVSVLEENGDHLAFIYSLHEVNPGLAETDAKGVEIHKKKIKEAEDETFCWISPAMK